MPRLTGRKFTKGDGGEHGPAIEIYLTKRYFAVTGMALNGSDEARQIDIGDFEWVLNEAGPEFAGKAEQGEQGEEDGARSKAKGAQRKPPDTSRSGKGASRIYALVREGLAYESVRDALLTDADFAIAAWANTKGRDNDEREIRKVFAKAREFYCFKDDDNRPRSPRPSKRRRVDANHAPVGQAPIEGRAHGG